MGFHVVSDGECMLSMAERFGFVDYRTIWDHPENAPLREKRPNPAVLSPGDAVYVPERRAYAATCRIDAPSRVVIATRPARLRLVLAGDGEVAWGGKRFVLRVGSVQIEGTTTPEGVVEAEIPADEDTGQLRVWLDEEEDDPDLERELALGHLDPVEVVAGLQARLDNLGFRCPISGELDETTRAAISAFAVDAGLPVTDEPTGELRAALLAAHDEAAR